MEEVISVIVSIYNGAKYIEKCVSSIQNSTYTNLEIILVNDGSKDNSMELCQELAKKDSRIKVFSKQNGGIASARSFGLEKATGKYICFADQDDVVYPNSYEILKKNLESFDSDLCIGSFDCLRGNKKQYFAATEKNRQMNRKEIEQYLFQMCNFMINTNYQFDAKLYLVSVWNCIYKREIIEKYHISFKSFFSCEDDSLFNFDYMMYAQKVSFEKASVYGWIQNIRSYSHSTRYIPDYYNRRYQFFQYLMAQIKEIHYENLAIDFEKWEKLFKERNFIEAVINDAHVSNSKECKERISDLESLYQKLKGDGCNFIELNIVKILREPYYYTWKCCMNGKIKKAFHLNYIWYNKIILPFIQLLKKIYYSI